jgi:hypothetical protein
VSLHHSCACLRLLYFHRTSHEIKKDCVNGWMDVWFCARVIWLSCSAQELLFLHAVCIYVCVLVRMCMLDCLGWNSCMWEWTRSDPSFIVWCGGILGAGTSTGLLPCHFPFAHTHVPAWFTRVRFCAFAYTPSSFLHALAATSLMHVFALRHKKWMTVIVFPVRA